MCLARVYDSSKVEDRPMLGDVASLRFKDGKLLLTTLFGEQKEVDAVISEIDFRTSRILLENVKSPGN